MSILNEIVADTKILVEQRKAEISIGSLESSALYNKARLNFEAALAGDHLSVIAEVKKASPSKGVIRADFEPTRIAAQYTAGGAHAISVLTEPKYFQGQLKFLSDVRETTPLPLLRKDFIIDPYQLIEARSFGADAVLLIAAVLDKKQLFDLHQAAVELNLACLVEVYDAKEIDQLDFNQVQILGVNNRDLHTFTVNLHHSVEVFKTVPGNVLKVSESGINTGEDLHFLRSRGSDAVLIGESLMRARQPGEKLKTIYRDMNERMAASHETISHE